MNLEIIIPSEVTQSQKKKKHISYVFTYKYTLLIKYRSTILKCTDPKKLGNMEVPRKDAQISPIRGI